VCHNKNISESNFELQILFNDEWQTFMKLNKKENSFTPAINKRIPSVIIVDNFYENPDSVREFAMMQPFEEHPKYHKGKRTNNVFLFDGIKESFESYIGCKIINWNKYGANGCFQYCILGDEIVYHCDRQEYAAIIFLTPDAPPETGTTLFRSKITNVHNHDIIFKNGFLDGTKFDEVDKVGNVYNRLFIFHSKIIHAASSYFGDNLQNGRLFQMFFFDIEK
jgi:hypothetical protein